MIASAQTYRPSHAIGDRVLALGIPGEVLEAVWGPSRNWAHRQWYFLVKLTKFKPHWFLQEEVIST